MKASDVGKQIGGQSAILTLIAAIGYQPLLAIAEEVITKKVSERVDKMEAQVQEVSAQVKAQNEMIKAMYQIIAQPQPEPTHDQPGETTD